MQCKPLVRNTNIKMEKQFRRKEKFSGKNYCFRISLRVNENLLTEISTHVEPYLKFSI